MERNEQQRPFNGLKAIVLVLSVIGVLSYVAYRFWNSGPETTTTETVKVATDDPDRIENGIHLRTGLKAADGLQEVVANCTSCHSAQLVTQNRMDREEWIATIRWMQETQNLWDLGANEAIIVNYLVTNYPPMKKGRRQALQNIDWYTLAE